MSSGRSTGAMKNTHFSAPKEDEENMAASFKRIHAFSRETNKANGSEHSHCREAEARRRLNYMLHGGSVLGPGEAYMVGVFEAESVSTTTSTTHEQKDSSSGGRERLKRHREEVAGRVSIPDKWGQEELLKDWIDCSSFEALMVPNKIASARKALVAAADHGAASHQLRIESRC